MQILKQSLNEVKTRKKGIKIKATQVITRLDENGKEYQITKNKKIRLYKHIPKGCSRPKQLCLECFKSGKTTYIHRNDANYDSKICKACSLD